MFRLLGLLLLTQSGCWRFVACASIVVTRDSFGAEGRAMVNGADDNSMIEETREQLDFTHRRSRRDSETSATNLSVRMAYERAINRTVEDYYAQRKAVMDRYHAKQREIIDKFSSKSASRSSSRGSNTIETTTTRRPDNNLISVESTSPEIINERDDNNVIFLDRGSLRDSKIRENATEADSAGEFTDHVAVQVDRKEIPGYYRLGQFRGTKNEKIVYQHNLGIGLKGPSTLEANFEVILEGAFNITAIEAFPYGNNTRAHFSWISGGPGTNSVKLKLRGYDNEGFSYTVKVWAIPA